MTTETRELTAQDAQQIDAAVKQLRENGFDVWTQKGTQHNADLLDEYFQTNRVPITVQAVFKAVETRKADYKWLSAAENAWYKTAQQNPELGNQLAAHLATQGGRPDRLVNDGDELFENLLLLFEQIHSRRETVSPQTIAGAEDRIAHRPGRQLHRVPRPRRTEPISPAAKAHDGTPFLGRDLVQQSDGSYRSKTPAEQRREAEAADRANSSQAQTPALDATEQAWKSMADNLLRDGTHSQQQRVRAVYDREQGNGWRHIYEACKREVNIYKNRGIR
jgi:hypothetical protein